MSKLRVDERYKNNTEKFIADGLLNQPNLYTQDYLSQTLLYIHYRILFLSAFSPRLYIQPLTVYLQYVLHLPTSSLHIDI